MNLHLLFTLLAIASFLAALYDGRAVPLGLIFLTVALAIVP